MNIATLNVHGDDDGLADLRDGLPVEPDGHWRRGDLKPDGRERIDSGFHARIGAAHDPDELLQQVRSFLAESAARGLHFERADVAAELRIALHAEQSLDFSLADLRLLCEMGIHLSIVA